MPRRRILVVDRNDSFVEKCRHVLGALGHECLAAPDGPLALAAILEARPDVVLANAHATEAESGAFTARAKELDPALPVVLLFSKESAETRATFERSGADNYLIRPLKESELVAAIRAMLALRGLEQKLVAVLEERDQLARDAAGSQLERDARERYYQFEFFKKIVTIELKRSRRYRFPLSLMLVSFDASEAIAGSAHARRLFGDLARVIRAGIRDIDIPISFSEETVLVLMPHTPADGALVVAERIREQAAALPETYGVVPETTVSVGLVCSQATARLDFGTLVQQVTKALRQAKKRGGNRVVMA